jgi:eukaryotic-like serine/threonine-protein kinase
LAEVGQMLYGRYRIVELLGQGGMATIYRGHDSQLGRDVAIKVLRAEYGRDPAFVARFRQEAQSAAVLNHPNVVNVFDFGMEGGDPFIVMELIDGGDLAGRIAEGPLPPVEAARIAQQIYEALDAAHARGIVHRDIKPTNVLLTKSGRVKVADLGIARAFSEAQLTMPGTTLGSVHYFSPEQARGEMVTSASDIYSAGLVLFEMLTGRRAWTGDSAGAVAVARLTGDPPVPSSVRDGIPPVLDEAVARALTRIPADRPTAGEMAALLGRFIADPQNATGFAASGAAGAAAVAGAVALDSVAAAQLAARDAAGSQVTQPVEGAPPGLVGGEAGDSGYYSSPPRYDATADQYAGGPAYGTVRGGVPPRRGTTVEEEPEEESAGTWGWVAAMLGVLVLFAGGLLLFLLLSRPGPSASPSPGVRLVVVPSFVGMSFDDAQRDADDVGLVLTVGQYEVAESAAENTVIAQDPVPGGQVSPGSLVTVTLSTLSPTVPVPDVYLQTEAQFFAVLAQNDLIPGVRSEAYDPVVPPTLLIRTNPHAGVEVARGTAIDYVVSLGLAPTPTPTPLITPTPEITPTPTPPPTPTPIVTPPPPPTLAPTPTVPPTPVPTPVTVGNYSTCGTLGEAKMQIEANDLVVGIVNPLSAGTIGDDWLVIPGQQIPEPNAQVQPGTSVDLAVKDPTDGPPECP